MYPGSGIALIGLLVLNADAVDGASFAGMAFPLLAGFSYACYFVFSKPLAQNASPGSVMMVLCLLSGPCCRSAFPARGGSPAIASKLLPLVQPSPCSRDSPPSGVAATGRRPVRQKPIDGALGVV